MGVAPGGRAAKHLLTLIALLATAPATHAQNARTERIELASGGPLRTIKASIRGRSIVDYNLTVRAGQRISLSLTPSNRSTYFNVTAAGADTAMFIGSIAGDTYEFIASSAGNYTVRVYLMANAARRNEKSNYRLSIAVS